MRNLIFLTLFLIISVPIYSQLNPFPNLGGGSRYGVKISRGFINSNPETVLLINNAGQFYQRLQLVESSPQYSFGLWGQKRFGWLYAEGNALYSNYGMDYKLYSGFSDEVPATALSESFNYLNIQVMAGIQAHGFRIGVGPIAYLFLNHSTDLDQINQLSERFRTTSYGFSGAIGYDYGRFSFDLKIDRAFRTVGDHIFYENRKSKFSETPSALTMSLAYAIIKK